MPVYVRMSESSMDDDCFVDEINAMGPTAEFEVMLEKKLSVLGNKMSQAINAPNGTFDGLLEYSLPIELVSSEPVDVEPDYEYVE